MVKIRLRRVGSKKKPSYRIVVADVRAPRGGAFIETIGYYNPLTEPSTVEVNREKALEWLRRGAKLTDITLRLFRRVGLVDEFPEAKAAS